MATRGVDRIPTALTLALALAACSCDGNTAGGEGGNAGASSPSSGGSDATTGGAGGAVSTGEGGMATASGGVAMNTGGVATNTGGVATSTGGSATNTGGASSGAASGAASGGASGGDGGASGTGAEKALAELLVARQEHAVVALAGEVYVIGGYAPRMITDSVQAYDPAKDSWRDVKAFPEPIDHANAGVVGEKIYVAGFYVIDAISKATTQNFSYDPKSDTWTERAPLPASTQRAAACVAVDAGLMYVIGGASEGKSVAYAARYDAAGDEWEELPPLPERREHCAAGAIDGIIYVAGGRVDGITGVEPKTWAYDPAAKSWTEKASLAPPRGGLAGAVLRGQLYVFGGEGDSSRASGVFPNIDVYDPVANSWQALTPMLVPRHGYGAAVLDGRIYLPGGAISQGAGAAKNNSVFYFP